MVPLALVVCMFRPALPLQHPPAGSVISIHCSDSESGPESCELSLGPCCSSGGSPSSSSSPRNQPSPSVHNTVTPSSPSSPRNPPSTCLHNTLTPSSPSSPRTPPSLAVPAYTSLPQEGPSSPRKEEGSTGTSATPASPACTQPWCGFSPLSPGSECPSTLAEMVATRSRGKGKAVETPPPPMVKHARQRTTPASAVLRKRKPKRAKDLGGPSVCQQGEELPHAGVIDRSMGHGKEPSDAAAIAGAAVCHEEVESMSTASIREGHGQSSGQEVTMSDADDDESSKQEYWKEAECAAKAGKAENKADVREQPNINESLDFFLLRADVDWEERRYTHRYANGRFIKKWACLLPACRDPHGRPRLFSRLESFNSHRMRFHFGSTPVYSDLGKVREEVSSYLKTPVRNIKEQHAHKVYQKINRLNIRAEIFYGSELACVCHTHKALLIRLKEEYFAQFKAQGLADYTLRRKGVHVEARHSLNKPPLECIVCRGDFLEAVGAQGIKEPSSMHTAGTPEELGADVVDTPEDTPEELGADVEDTTEDTPEELGADVEDTTEDEPRPSTPVASSHEKVVEDLCNLLSRSLPRTRSRASRSKDADTSSSTQATRRSTRKK